MKYLVPFLILAMIFCLSGCNAGGIANAFVVDLNFLPPDGEAPLGVSGSVQIEGGSSGALTGYNFVWTIPAIPSFLSTSTSFSYLFENPGTYRVNLNVTDKATGQAVLTSGTINVHPDVGELQALIDFINPDEDPDGKAPAGKAPFTVELGATVTGGQEPYFYEWDYNSDGVSEGWGWGVDGYWATYASKGTYTVTLKVTDDRGTTSTDTRNVNVLPSNPVAVANSLPPEGPVGMWGLFVVFSATGSYDPDGEIVLWEWDFDNDGVYDWSSMVTGSTSNGYTEPGNYYPTLRVTDNDGLTGLATAQVIVTY